ncbi:carbonic anhydrase 4-like [Diadema setosum]|uniref:carbonic anhydrase 4-like n=1 Tax=Diadema setosum TaxID=31175 RepID=UPI003B3AE91C
MACLQFSLPLYFVAAAIAFGSSHYGVQGPLHWSSSYPNCAGSSQSPIAVSCSTAAQKSTSDRFCFDGYDEERNLDIKNNGHSVFIAKFWSRSDTSIPTPNQSSSPQWIAASTPDTVQAIPCPLVKRLQPLHQIQVTLPSNSYFIKGGGLPGEYQALQFHFHWGSDSTKGSEHSMDGVTYPAEMHIVHRKVGLTADEALQVNDGLAVLAIMIEIGDKTNENFDAIVESLSDIPKSDETTTSGDFSLDDLLPDNRQDFFRYYGSLTTPTCDESVVWTVFADQVEISENQIAAFRCLYFDEAGSEQMVNNFRPIQALNGRTVTRYSIDASSDSSSSCDDDADGDSGMCS